MPSRGLGRDQVHNAAWVEAYPHPAASCLMPVTAILALIALAMGGFWLWQRSLPDSVSIPAVEGLTLDEAQTALRRADLRFKVIEQRQTSEKVPEGSIISITPEAGRMVKTGRVVNLLVSAGSVYTTVPDVRELSQSAARERLRAAKLFVATEKYVFDEAIPFDRVITITPKAGTKVKRDSTVSLVLSKGTEPEVDMSVSDLRSSVVTVDLPTDTDDPAEARIDVTDDNGTRTVFREVRKPGETIIETVQGAGEMTVEVYFGERLVLTRTL